MQMSLRVSETVENLSLCTDTLTHDGVSYNLFVLFKQIDLVQCQITDPANMKCWPNAELMLGQRWRRWSNIRPALGQCLVLADWAQHGYYYTLVSFSLASAQQNLDVEQTSVLCWARVWVRWPSNKTMLGQRSVLALIENSQHSPQARARED